MSFKFDALPLTETSLFLSKYTVVYFKLKFDFICADDHKVRYHEEDPNQLQAAKMRRPRRHTTGGSQQKDAIEKAKQMLTNDSSIDSKTNEKNYGTLNRKEFVSLLKTRYGNDIEKYRSLKKVGSNVIILYIYDCIVLCSLNYIFTH